MKRLKYVLNYRRKVDPPPPAWRRMLLPCGLLVFAYSLTWLVVTLLA